ncbi:hypothetical protein C4D60_Mb06t28830 [Musa balbisiana]|uniref:Uncharacterized protein n=1 Tax=Musa balbisiana TaxID=52838 RepID=A0A4S8IRF4_MUSBA|nr:hypothetical protein C4D60_Mb06t28830 [Musa balbisiana]
METPLPDGHAEWVIRAYQTKGTTESQPSSSPVVIKLGYTVIHFLEGRFVEERPRAYHTFVFNLGDFLHQASRRRAISTVLLRAGAYGYDICFAWGLETHLIAFCNEPVETAFNSGNGIEMIVDRHLLFPASGLHIAKDEEKRSASGMVDNGVRVVHTLMRT